MGKTIAMVVGWVFLVIGILGFIPNPLVGEDALFQTDLNHNIVHLLSGIIFLWVAYKASEKSTMLLKVFGVVYLLVAILGFFMADGGSILGLIEVNGADNWLHVLLGVVLLGAGLMGGKSSSMPMSNMGGMNNMGGGMGQM